MARIFISYSRTDETFARQLTTSLSQMGANVWIDIEDIASGMKWSRAIQEGLDTSDVLLVIISPDSMGSHNVEDEWQYYLDQKKPVVPLLLTPTKLHFQLSRIQYVDFHKQSYDKGLRQLHAELGRKGVTLDAPPRRSTVTQQVARVDSVSGAAPARRFPILWLIGGAVVLVIGIGLGLILSNPDRLRSNEILPTSTAVETARPSLTAASVVLPTALPDNSGKGNVESPVYDSDGIYFEYPQGWWTDETHDGDQSFVYIANNQDILDTWRQKDFSLNNSVGDGEIAIALIHNIEDVLDVGDSNNAWDVVDVLRQSLPNTDEYGFSDISEYTVSSGEAAYTLGNIGTNAIEILVIDTEGDASCVLIFGAAAVDQVTTMVATVRSIATSLEI